MSVAGTLPPVELTDAPEPVRAVVAEVVRLCVERREHDRIAARKVREREHLQGVLHHEHGLPMRTVADLCVQALRQAGFTDAELDTAGVQYGGVRRALKAWRPDDNDPR